MPSGGTRQTSIRPQAAITGAREPPLLRCQAGRLHNGLR
jgi:hypothetical protein